MTITDGSTQRPRPECVPTPCHMPAVGAWAVYDYASGKPRWIDAVYYCRFHERPARDTAGQLATKTGPKASTYPSEIRRSVNGPVCREDRNPIQLGEVLDQERITHAAEKIRDGMAELAHLTANGWGDSFRIGNEEAVLRAFLELAPVAEEWVGVAARRLATRSSWEDVAGVLKPFVTRPITALGAWREWGGGPGDEEPPDAT